MPDNYADNSSNRYKYYVFTLNNYSEVDIMKLKLYANEKCRYITFGKEKGSKKETPHLQGYMQLKQATAGKTVKNQSKCLSIWLHPANGSGQEARDYCLKQDKNAYQWGDFLDHPRTNANGVRTGAAAGGKATKDLWVSLKDDIKKGAQEKDIADKYPHLYFKHASGVKSGITAFNAIPIRKEKTCVHVYIGPPGCGKTTKAMELAGQSAFLYNSPNKIWWTGYDGTSNVILDDFHGNYPFSDFKLLTDKYPHKVPVHNGMINFNAPLLIITSNMMPGEWWKQEVLGTHGYAALLRRINVLGVWDENLKDFVPTDLQDRLWSDGCICDPKFPSRAPTVEIIEDLDVIPETQMEPLPLPNPKKRKLNLPGKTIGELTKGLDKLYPPPVVGDSLQDPFEVDTQSDEDDLPSDFDSSNLDSSDSEEQSESF